MYKINFRSILKKINRFFLLVGFSLNKFKNLIFIFQFIGQKREWIKQGGEINENYIVLSDYKENAGVIKGHYFHQDLLVSGFIFENKPKRHIDIGSRIDGFVSSVASYRKIEILDIRSLPTSGHKNIIFKQADLTKNNDIGKTDSISCLHAIEHFGMGRYGDEIDVKGHEKGLKNIVELLEKEGILYLSFPIGNSDSVHFNAHRIFHPKTIFSIDSISKNMKLLRFDYVDDYGDLHQDVKIETTDIKVKFGCGIYTFKKI